MWQNIWRRDFANLSDQLKAVLVRLSYRFPLGFNSPAPGGFVSLSLFLTLGDFFVHPQKKVGNLHKVACYQRASSDVEAILPAVFLRFKSRRLSKYVDISKFSMGGIYLISSLVKERLTLTLLERNDTITRAFYLIT